MSPSRRPALIARCAGADDVVRAVRLAREHDLALSVRGGQAVAGHGVVDGGLMIDLSLMKAVRVDPEAQVARAAGGLLWRELDGATQRFGLATAGGIIGHAGIGGLILGGGWATWCAAVLPGRRVGHGRSGQPGRPRRHRRRRA
jgi:FAD/FMN-containing dehydrogenase